MSLLIVVKRVGGDGIFPPYMLMGVVVFIPLIHKQEDLPLVSGVR